MSENMPSSGNNTTVSGNDTTINGSYSKNFISDIKNNNNNLYPDFPLNLLPEMDTLISVILLFLIIIFNVFVAHKLININYKKYIPNNKLGSIINFFLTRYIKIWNQSSNNLIIYSWLMIFAVTVLLKICMYYILNST